MIPIFNIQYEGEIMIVAAIGIALASLKAFKGWGKILALVLTGVLFTVGLTRSTFLGGMGGES